MKKILLAVAAMATIGLFAAFTLPGNQIQTTGPEVKETAESIKWYTWEEAIELNKTEPRKLFIDLYTDWCGWCKRMDATTFTDPAVVQHINDNYYPIKFDAEQKEEVIYNGHTFKYIASGRRGVHELAYSLLDGKLSYPSYVYMTKDVERLYVSKGYKPADQLIKELNYFTEEKYLETDQ
ncbi:MAG TPA: DUF255 domain-containing protein [Saprospiraceae bacterium]|nr:DUF255 domain-containing protein [Saprospiraceae bacterium]